MKLPEWLYSEVTFEFVNRWKCWQKNGDYFVIWLGTEVLCGDDYHKIRNQYSLDFTLCNFGFKARIRIKPSVWVGYGCKKTAAESMANKAIESLSCKKKGKAK